MSNVSILTHTSYSSLLILTDGQIDVQVDQLVFNNAIVDHAVIICHQATNWKMLELAVTEADTLIDLLMLRLQEKAADTIESLHKAGMKVWVLTGDKMETAAATCYASKLFRRSTQILELTKKRTEEQSLHDVLFELNRTVIRQRSMSGYETIHVQINAVDPFVTYSSIYFILEEDKGRVCPLSKSAGFNGLPYFC